MGVSHVMLRQGREHTNLHEPQSRQGSDGSEERVPAKLDHCAACSAAAMINDLTCCPSYRMFQTDTSLDTTEVEVVISLPVCVLVGLWTNFYIGNCWCCGGNLEC
jgi:hypothetical protein